MRTLHRHLFAYLFGLAAFTNLVVAATHGADVPAYVPTLFLTYGLGCALAVVVVEPSRSLLAFVVVIGVALGYGGTRALAIASTPVAPWDVAAAVLETLLLGACVVLGSRLSRSMRSLRDVTGWLSAAAGGDDAVPRAAEDPRVRREMARSRRYGRPLSVVVIEPNAPSVSAAWDDLEELARESFVRRYLGSRLKRLIARHLRFVDVLLEDTGSGRFIVVCPEADASDVEGMLRRIRLEATRSERVDLASGHATFPHRAVTFEALVEEAEAGLRRPLAAVPREVVQGPVVSAVARVERP